VPIRGGNIGERGRKPQEKGGLKSHGDGASRSTDQSEQRRREKIFSKET